jgi:hypothetical protein
MTSSAGVGVVALAAFSVLGASQVAHVPARQPPASDIPAVFRPLYQGPVAADRAEALRAALPYDRITMERSGGMVIGTAFKLALSRSGEATLSGSAFGRTGESVGTIGLVEFGKLSHLIARVGFDRLAPQYEIPWTDMTTTTVTVSAPGRSMSVADYGGAGPVEVWAVERAIDSIAQGIVWKPR